MRRGEAEVGSTGAQRAAAASAFVLMLLPFAATAAHATDTPGPCAIPFADGETVRAHVKDLIRCAVDRWPVRGGATTAICIAKRESGLIPTAVSPSGVNLGLFQQHRDYWDANYDTYTRPRWELKHSALNGRTNTIVSIRMAADGGWRPWGGSDCG